MPSPTSPVSFLSPPNASAPIAQVQPEPPVVTSSTPTGISPTSTEPSDTPSGTTTSKSSTTKQDTVEPSSENFSTTGSLSASGTEKPFVIEVPKDIIPLHRSRLVLIPILRAILANDTKGLRNPKALLPSVAQLDFEDIGEEEVLNFLNQFLLPALRLHLPKFASDYNHINDIASGDE